MNEISTKERILDTAERLFAEKGIKETSLRDITSAVGVNCAAVNYHFSSKEGLIHAVITRRFEPLNQQRLCLLKSYEVEAGKKPVPLKRILYAWIAPTIELYLKNPYFMSIAGRIISDPNKEHYSFFVPQFEQIFLRFKDVLTQALPNLPERELLLRMLFILGAMIHTWTNHSDLGRFSSGPWPQTIGDGVTESLINFCAAGLKAPLPTQFGETHEKSGSE
ncbi:MAG: TetR/AcrR family transcriptional regulator [Ignavibacteriales bacterium]